uniref:uncharacterized protein LOC117610925 n=1 Tax=Osmia lignaria TaxID=473952 RepID=UPI0014784A52|nr:uncharacterized protein LOC117610925 [Osmia lignaria]
MVSVKCLKTKYEVKDAVTDYITRIERQTGKKIKRFRTDNGLEYCNNDLTAYFNQLEIKHERSNVETPQMNGVTKRLNRTLLNLTRAMLKSSGLPQKFWAEAVVMAGYIQNRTGHSATGGIVPLTFWSDRKPSVRHLKIFGCLAYAHLPSQGRRKLDDRAVECIFVGYATQMRGYRLWCPRKQDVITTKHVKFAEDKMDYGWIYRKDVESYRYNQVWSDDDEEIAGGDIGTLEEDIRLEQPDGQDHMMREDETVGAHDTAQAKKGGRPKKVIRNPYGCKGKPSAQEDEVRSLPEEDNEIEDSDIEANLVEIVEPQSLKEALNSPQAAEWKNAINEELDSLTSRRTWEVTNLPEGRKCIGCRWVFKLKTDTVITRYKARLVAQDFSQEKWHTRHVDIKCAYLYGELREEIFMKPPPPLYEVKEGTVVRLLCPIYGLKQSGRSWNQELNDFLTDLKSVTDTVRHITERYEAKDLGEISQALEVKVERNSVGDMRLSQRLCTEAILKKYNMIDCRRASTPLDPGLRVSKRDAPTVREERALMKSVLYRELIGALMFLALYTRPDILFAVTKLSQYNSNPGKQHWLQVKHILRYLSATKDYGIVYKTGVSPKIGMHCDADWINCDNRAAIDFAKSRIENSRTKHIDIAYHIVREQLEEGLINLTFVPSNENLADGMTKGLKKIAHDCYVKHMRLTKEALAAGRKVATAPSGYPKTTLTAVQRDLVLRAFEAELDAITAGKEVPRFEGNRQEQGIIWVTCSDNMAREWLKTTVVRVRPWEGAALQLLRECLPRLHKLITVIPGPPAETGTILSRPKGQNPGFNTQQWRGWDRKEEARSVQLVVEVEGESLLALKSWSFVAHVGLDRVLFGEPRARPDGGRHEPAGKEGTTKEGSAKPPEAIGSWGDSGAQDAESASASAGTEVASATTEASGEGEPADTAGRE